VYASAEMRPHGRTTLLLFVVFQALYVLTSSGNAFRVPDEFEVYFQIEHLVDAGDLTVPQTLQIRSQNGAPVFFGRFGVDGRPYAPYGPLAAVLALPHHLLARALAAVAGVPRAPLPEGLAWVFLVGGLTMTATATAAALAVAGFHRAALALDTPPRPALLLSLLLGAATVLWPYGTSFYSEAWQAAAFIWAAAMLLAARRDAAARPGRASTRVVVASLLLAVAGLVKVTSLVFAPGFVVAALFERSLPARRCVAVAAALSAGIAAATAIQIGWNLYRFGLPFEFGYGWGETIPQPPVRAFLASDIPRGLAVLLLSPGKSIVLWAPPLLLAALHARRFWRREPSVARGIAATGAIGLLLFAAYVFPEGGYSHGPRNLVPIVPLLLLFAAGADAGAWPRGAIVACAATGMTVALLATSVSFLEDQGLGGDLGAGARTVYYERVDPPPGRVWNRYRLDYVPFIAALRSEGWPASRVLGQGPDYFPLHLLQARTQLPNGQAIPVWFVWAWPALWLAMLIAAAKTLNRETAKSGNGR
jgi:hypothetical protein